MARLNSTTVYWYLTFVSSAAKSKKVSFELTTHTCEASFSFATISQT